MGTTVWMTSRQQVDNFQLFTAWITTTVQDVLRRGSECAQRFVTAFGFASLHPQSTALITVIKSLYIHPQTTLKANMPGVTS